MSMSAKRRRGATMIFITILLPVLFALAGMAVNFAYIQVVKTKMQIVTDASVRAAGREYVNSADPALALAAAQQISNLNPVGTFVVPIEAGDLEFGASSRTGSNQKYTFNSGAANGNAVRLTTNALAGGSGSA
ncbi:MAG: hypothetical protein HKN47_24605, partial [Pirellulaceae bacterium]|nr:hypothetical protein [Pirellulaceae bacterium]